MTSSSNPVHDSGETPHIIEILQKKRRGHELSRAEIQHFVQAYTRGDIPDYQASAFLMAAVLQGMTRAETAHLTDAMLCSGRQIDLSHLPGRKVDKHSTGGVGDKTSLIIAPIAAAAGLVVPMNSGRGLGHTGGTLDKLEAIPGFRVALSIDEFEKVLEQCGCGIVSQTAEIAPADRKLYQLRHFTATIDHPSLICASIMSKKLAEGIDALVLDVKTGSGAFMREEAEAVRLAELMVETAERIGVRAVALITDMDQPLGREIGNALEVKEATDVLRGNGPDDLRELSVELAAWMLLLGGKAPALDSARIQVQKHIRDGSALQKFRNMIAAQSGDALVIDQPHRLPGARFHKPLPAKTSGFLSNIQTELVGTASVFLGAGRERADESVDHGVGFTLHAKLGDALNQGDPMLTIHYNSEARLDRAETLLQYAFEISERPPLCPPLIRHVVQNE